MFGRSIGDPQREGLLKILVNVCAGRFVRRPEEGNRLERKGGLRQQ